MMTMMMVITEMVTVMPPVAHHSLVSLLTASSANIIVVDGSSCGSGMLWRVGALSSGLITDPNTFKFDSDTLNLT